MMTSQSTSSLLREAFSFYATPPDPAHAGGSGLRVELEALQLPTTCLPMAAAPLKLEAATSLGENRSSFRQTKQGYAFVRTHDDRRVGGRGHRPHRAVMAAEHRTGTGSRGP